MSIPEPWHHEVAKNRAENIKLRAEIERLTAERDFARDAVVQKCRQYDADMKIMQDALNREIEKG